VQLTQALLDEKLTPDQIGLVMGGSVARLLGETLPRD
jgi:hypothetical protein